MQLEDYFDFLAPDDIRIKDHRIGIESILYEYIYRDRRAEQIVQTYPSLSLDQVYATILYYLVNKDKIDAYIEDWLEWGDRMRAEAARNPSPLALELRRIKAERAAAERMAAERKTTDYQTP